MAADDTIAAVTTPPGEGGVGVIRISGVNSFEVAGKIFRPARNKNWCAESHRMHYGHVVDQSGRVIDEVLLCAMKAPHTYTREDVVEINCHGGMIPLRETLKAVLASGARPAEPGEFTKRAFLNGRIDLTQAESVIDIIRSKTAASLKIAVSQLEGRLSDRLNFIQGRILGILAGIEATVDFPEDDLEERERRQLLEEAGEIIGELNILIRTAGEGRIYREGIRTVIAGRPNVGKSSLLNRLLGKERAIVTDIPGTTRDIIEETVNIRGIPLILTDTAGLRETWDPVEKIGVKKTRETLAGAEMILFVVDAKTGMTGDDREILESIGGVNVVLVVNKIDIENKKTEIYENWSFPVVKISALTGEGMDRLEEMVEIIATGGRIISPDSIIISNVRHEEALRRARAGMEDFISSLGRGLPADILSIDVRNSYEALGEITGSTVDEELLNRIFTDFCIGK